MSSASRNDCGPPSWRVPPRKREPRKRSQPPQRPNALGRPRKPGPKKRQKGGQLADRLVCEAEARAKSERNRRRTTVGLAASVLALAALGGGTWLVAERSRVQRYSAGVAALNETRRLHTIARDCADRRSRPLGGCHGRA